MESQIDELLEKYWGGETNLEEEKILKSHFKNNPALTNESHYMRYLASRKSVKYQKPSIFGIKKEWFLVASTLAIGIVTAALVFNDINRDPFAIDDPEKALQATKDALIMISFEINQGQSHALELIKINKAKEKLQEGS